jgi:formylglycine-generating enzyme required for sulfatase activity
MPFASLLPILMLVPGDAGAHRVPPPEAWWQGIDAPRAQAAAQGIQVLRPLPGGRVRIPGGTFVMGSSPAQMARAIALCEREIFALDCREEHFVAKLRAEGTAHPVTLSSFEMDRTEVTVAAYDRCVSAGACAPPELSGDQRFTRPDYPVTHVRWSDADDYCRWAGGYLPTEAQWEYAARGLRGRDFPWGDDYNPHLANHGAWAEDPTDATDGFVRVAPVGSFPDGATPLGLLDMAGNVSEWVADVMGFDKFGIPVGYDDTPETDPKPRVTGGGPHIFRGGSFRDAASWLRATARDYDLLPRPPWVGFRCAADAR